MTTNRDFKRLVRSRMSKTGESYTSARLQLLKHRPAASVPAPSPEPATAPKATAKADYAKVAGMSDAAVKKATGCTWEKWVGALDYAKAYEWPHASIALYVHEKFKVPSWWTQMVTVGYERIKGLREKGQRRGGSFEASRSKTFPVPVSRLFRAWSDKRTRTRWLAGAELTVRTSQKDKSMRITWGDGTSVELWFTARDKAKSQVAVTHAKLADKASAERMKAYWAGRLAALAEVLVPARKKTAA